MALRQLLLRFSATDHGDCHFRHGEESESLEKVTVLTGTSKTRRREPLAAQATITRFTEFTELQVARLAT